MTKQTPQNTRNMGAFAERAALIYLRFAGLSLVEKNYGSRLGEIDLIMLDPYTPRPVNTDTVAINSRNEAVPVFNLGQSVVQKHLRNLVTANQRQKLKGTFAAHIYQQYALVFVEVRYRKSKAYGSPAQTVSASKQTRIIKTAQLFLQRHPHMQAFRCRFDVVGVTNARFGKTFEWYKAAFESH